MMTQPCHPRTQRLGKPKASRKVNSPAICFKSSDLQERKTTLNVVYTPGPIPKTRFRCQFEPIAC